VNNLQVVELGSIAKFINGDRGVNYPSKDDFVESGVPFVNAGHLSGGEVSEAGMNFISPQKFDALGSGKLQRDDIIYCLRGSLGKTAIYRRESAAAIASSLVIIRPTESCSVDYLFHYLTGIEGQRLVKRFDNGSSQPNLSAASVKKYPIPLPPLSEQKRIAEILDRAEALRAKRRAALALLDELTQSIFLDMFGDPVSNPKGWPIQTFQDLGTLDRGISKNRPRNAPHLLGGSHPLIQTGDIANSGGYIRTFVSTYSDEGLKQSKKWPAGTLCITIAANIAKTGILTFEACFPDSVVGFKSDPSTTEYARVWLSFLQKTLEDAAPESAQKNINLGTLRKLPIPVPPIEKRTEFALRISTAEQLKEIERSGLEELDQLFASLQHRAFRGELSSRKTRARDEQL